MRLFYFTLAFVFLFACKPDSGTKKVDEETKTDRTAVNMDWLLGNWKRTNNSGTSQTFEYWNRGSAGTYEGLGITLENQDTVFKEIMSLEKVDDIWNLKVVGVNEDPTYFKFTSVSESGFVCENPLNEFPKKISYRGEGDKLTAVISAGDNAIDFEFVRLGIK